MQNYYIDFRFRQFIDSKHLNVYFEPVGSLDYDFKHIENEFVDFFSIKTDIKKYGVSPVLIHQEDQKNYTQNEIYKHYDNYKETRLVPQQMFCPHCNKLSDIKLHNMNTDKFIKNSNEYKSCEPILNSTKGIISESPNTKKIMLKEDAEFNYKNYSDNSENILNEKQNSENPRLIWDNTTMNQDFSGGNSDWSTSYTLTANGVYHPYDLNTYYKEFNVICCNCGYSVTSNKCLIHNFNKKVVLPHKITIESLKNTISLGIVFNEIVLENKMPLFTPCSLKLNFNCKTGNTTYIKSYYENNKLIKKKIKKMQNKDNLLIAEKIHTVFDKVCDQRIYEDLGRLIKQKHVEIIQEELNIKNANNMVSDIEFEINTNAYTISTSPTDSVIGAYTSSNVRLDSYRGLRASSTLGSIYNSSLCARAIIQYNRYPRLNNRRNFFNEYLPTKNKKQLIYNLKCHEDPIDYFIKEFKIKDCKSIRKLAYTDIRHLMAYPSLNSYFKDINNLSRLLEHFNRSHIFGFDIKSLRKMKRNENFFQIPFLDFLFTKFNETQVCNKLLTDSYYLYDAINIYDDIIKKYDSIYDVPNIEKSLLSGNIKKIHDYLSYIHDLMKSKNMPLRENIHKNTLAIETANDKYKLRFAYDTHELKAIGRQMNICVGSYANRALQQHCHILVVLEKNKYVTCIELKERPISGIVTQVKAYNNDYVDGDLEEFIVKWILDNKLKVETHDIDVPMPETKMLNYSESPMFSSAYLRTPQTQQLIRTICTS